MIPLLGLWVNLTKVLFRSEIIDPGHAALIILVSPWPNAVLNFWSYFPVHL